MILTMIQSGHHRGSKSLQTTMNQTVMRGILTSILLLAVLVSGTAGQVAQAGSEARGTSLNPALAYTTYLPFIQNQIGITYYVSTTGNDSNPGTWDRPYRTLRKAAEVVAAGDTVFIRGGVYQEAVDFKTSGTSRAPIKIWGFPGETAIIDGNNYTIPIEPGALLELSGSYIMVKDLEVRYSHFLGIYLSGTHDTVTQVNVHHNFHGGMNAGGDYSVIEQSLVWSNDMQNYNGQNPAGDSTGLTAARHPYHAVLRKNQVFQNWGIGLSTYEADGTILEDNLVYDNFGPNVYISDATHVLMQRNFIYATGAMTGGEQIGIQTGDEKSLPPSSDNTIINNIVFGTHRNLYCLEGSTHLMQNTLIANNTFVNSVEESGVEFKVGTYQNVSFTDNIIVQVESPGIQIIRVEESHPGLVFSYNLWSTTPILPAQGVGDIIQDPLFAKSGGQNSPEWYKLTNASPAIGAAVPLTQVTVDFFGDPRDTNPDMGADEYVQPPANRLFYFFLSAFGSN